MLLAMVMLFAPHYEASCCLNSEIKRNINKPLSPSASEKNVIKEHEIV
jgi:hypothetical protein